MQERPIHNPVCANPAEHESTIAQARWKQMRARYRPAAPRIRCRGSIKSGALALVLVSTLIALAGGLWLPLPLLGALLNENGPIENASVIFYGLAIAAVWMARNPSFGRAAAMASTIILISCIARETSLRRWLIDAGATSLCCSRATVGTLTALLVLLLIVSAAWLTVHYRKRLWDAIRRRSS